MSFTRKFTFVELLSLLVLIGLFTVVVFIQLKDFQSMADDKARKASINAIHQSLQEVHVKQHDSYPLTLNKEVLPTVDPDVLNDPNGQHINEATSQYHYEPFGCSENKCEAYYLYADLEKEGRYEKRSTDLLQ